jgi:hypothetical protein
MHKRLHRIFQQHPHLTHGDLNTLHGVISALANQYNVGRSSDGMDNRSETEDGDLLSEIVHTALQNSDGVRRNG